MLNKVSIFLLTLVFSSSQAFAYGDTVVVDNRNDGDSDMVLAVSTAAVAGLFALVSLSETSEENAEENYSKRMVKEARKYLANMERAGEAYATEMATEEFIARLAEEKARNPELETNQVVVKIIDSETRNIDGLFE